VGGGGGGVVAGGGGIASFGGASVAPQELQKLLSVVFSAPHFEQ
jgi:hypothetical protein